jgi:hypothetical protein
MLDRTLKDQVASERSEGVSEATCDTIQLGPYGPDLPGNPPHAEQFSHGFMGSVGTTEHGSVVPTEHGFVVDCEHPMFISCKVMKCLCELDTLSRK